MFMIAILQAPDSGYAPKHDDKSKEAKNVNRSHNALNERQLPEEDGVGEDS